RACPRRDLRPFPTRRSSDLLVTLGCVMMRVCHQDTCPMGIATQNPELRKRFCGKPEYVENFMRFIARQLREYMAKLGVRTVDEMVGRTDLLRQTHSEGRAAELDLRRVLASAGRENGSAVFDPAEAYDFTLDKTLDRALMEKEPVRRSLSEGAPYRLGVEVKNTDRAFGALLGAEITR